jgi:hypothetical protein
MRRRHRFRRVPCRGDGKAIQNRACGAGDGVDRAVAVDNGGVGDPVPLADRRFGPDEAAVEADSGRHGNGFQVGIGFDPNLVGR